ncbi:hypothetical protein SB2_11930 [Methylobacterium radiotolerans]|nr:hypothetical protein SB3_11125 [Methylobacterium radiotolerans]KTS47999.1 hypothetical protein SB2_11930 [Methylobacterium radiotolerans]
MTPQSLAGGASIILTFIAGILGARGLISKETQDYLGGPETLAFLSVLATAILGAWALWANRPHGIIKSAAALPQVDAVITKAKTAEEIPADNVVSTLAEAARVPGVSAH